MLGGRNHLGHAGNHLPALLVDAPAIEQDDAFFRAFFGGRNGGGDRIANTDRVAESQGLRQINRAWAGQHGAQHRGYQRAAPHAVRHDVMEHIAGGKVLVDMGRIDVTGDHGEQVDIGLGERARNGGAVANGNVVECPIFDKCHLIAGARGVGHGR